MLKKIVVTTDGSDRAGRAVGFAGELAQRFGGSLTVMHVRIGDTQIPPGVQKQADLAGGTVAIVPGESPDQAICDYADEIGADAIVIGNYGMSDRKQFLMSNVPNRVSHNAPCTVIIVDTRDSKGRKRRR